MRETFLNHTNVRRLLVDMRCLSHVTNIRQLMNSDESSLWAE